METTKIIVPVLNESGMRCIMEPLTMSKHQSADGMPHPLYIQREWFEFREVTA